MQFDEHPDWDEVDYWLADVLRVQARSPLESLSMVAASIDDLDDDLLCRVGVVFVESLIDVHWNEVGNEFEAALHEHVGLRKALSCASLQDDGLQQRLDGFIAPGEDIGRQPSEPRPTPRWERLPRPAVRDVRLSGLTEMLERAAAADLEKGIEPTRVEEIADPGAGHMLWPRFKCIPVEPRSPSFYRCAVRLFLAHQRVVEAVLEADLLVDDVEALPETPPWRVAALFIRSSELLPSVDEL